MTFQTPIRNLKKKHPPLSHGAHTLTFFSLAHTGKQFDNERGIRIEITFLPRLISRIGRLGPIEWNTRHFYRKPRLSKRG